MEDEMQRDLENAQTQIRNIEQELAKVELMQQNLARLQGVEAYLISKLDPPPVEDVPEPAVDGKVAKGGE